jgi:hypothetical protein
VRPVAPSIIMRRRPTQMPGNNVDLRSQGDDRRWLRRAYFVAPKRLSNEFDDTIGAEPETWELET